MDDPTGTSAAVREEMVRYLLGSDARAAARSELHRRGLDLLEPDDLINDVVLRVLRSNIADHVQNPIAYARRALTHRAADLLRGDLARREHVAPAHHGRDDDDTSTVEPSDRDALDPAVEAAIRDMEDALRRALHLRLGHRGTKVWAIAAALTTITLEVHRDVAVPDDVPEPEAASRASADRWAALWLAGEDGVFADPANGRHDGPALRKARSRRLQEVDRALQEAAARVTGGDGDG